MNRLGILIDITHGTDATQRQLIEASKVPVVCSHVTIRSVAGTGMSDDILNRLASKGGLVGIHGGAAVIGKRYRQWMVEHPNESKEVGSSGANMVGFRPSQPRSSGDYGEYIALFDKEFADIWLLVEHVTASRGSSRTLGVTVGRRHELVAPVIAITGSAPGGSRA